MMPRRPSSSCSSAIFCILSAQASPAHIDSKVDMGASNSGGHSRHGRQASQFGCFTCFKRQFNYMDAHDGLKELLEALYAALHMEVGCHSCIIQRALLSLQAPSTSQIACDLPTASVCIRGATSWDLEPVAGFWTLTALVR